MLELLQIRLDKATRRLRSAEAPTVYREQGICQEIEDVIRAIRTAPNRGE